MQTQYSDLIERQRAVLARFRKLIDSGNIDPDLAPKMVQAMHHIEALLDPLGADVVSVIPSVIEKMRENVEELETVLGELETMWPRSS